MLFVKIQGIGLGSTDVGNIVLLDLFYMKSKIEIKQFKNIAIIQTAFIGDTALAIYLAAAVKKFNLNSNITFISTPAASSILKCSKDIDNIIEYDKRKSDKGLKGIKNIAKELILKNIDCIIAPHRSLRTTLLTYYTKPVYSIGFDVNSFSFLYNKRIKYYRHLHEIDRNYELLKAFSDISINSFKNIKPNLNFSTDVKKFVNDLINNIDSKKIILFAPGSVWETKRWNEDYFAELGRLLKKGGWEVILIGSLQDKELCYRISDKSKVINLAGVTTLPQTTYLLSLSKLLITNDSSPIHLAGLVNCPVIAIFGPTSPMFGFAPRGENDIIIENNTLKCKPCAIHGGRKCPLGTLKCMNSIKPEFVLEKSIFLLNNVSSI
jgi:heptosyltransferase II